MKGVVFDVTRDVVCEEFSITVWDQILRTAGVDGAYTSLGNYPDSELYAIVGAAAAATSMSPTELLTWLGRRAFARLAELVPYLMSDIDSWQRLLIDLDGIIHTEVTRIHPGAVVPGFTATHADGGIELRYTSTRGLCALAEGLILGAGDWFGESLQVDHRACTHRGAAQCVLFVHQGTTRA